MKSLQLFGIGAAIAVVGLVIAFTRSLGVGMAIACLGGFGPMSVACFLHTRSWVPVGVKGERIQLAMFYTIGVLMALIAVAPLVLVIGIALTTD